MKTKIKWFKEVLELEPGSKVFFPLARLYYEDGLLDEAEETLLQGLERNADHLEARFLLVEILERQNEDLRAAEEVQAIARVLSRYPSFWQKWAQNSAGASRDSAMALSFLAAGFQGQPISWSQVIEKGLDVLVPQGGGASTATAPAAFAPASDDGANLRTRTMADLLAEQGDHQGALDIYEELAAGCAPGEEGDLPDHIALMREKLGQDGDEDDLGETVTRFLDGLAPSRALEDDSLAPPDYEELAELEAAPDFDAVAPEAEPHEALDDLDTLDALGEPAPEGPQRGMPGKDQLLQTLEALADRLEARSAV
ncbi:tetratricopeptide repeat protein [Desulfocurvus sp. DL9XJH121]